MQKLRISENRRYFEKEDGTPFCWIADTVWTMPQRLKWDDAEYLMEKRKSQGFTVLQMVALDPERDVEMRNPAGIKALKGDDLSKPNEKYFEYLDWLLDKAEEYGFYVLLLPVWGQLVVGDDWAGGVFEKTVTEENAYGYGAWIGRRYGQRKNIIWCLGGDRQPFHKGVDYRMVWRRMAEGLAKGALNKDLKYNANPEEWEKLLITYHACHEAETGECSTMSYWTNQEAWIQFIMLQSGHGLAPKNYELVEKEYNRVKDYGQTKTMPVWDGEPAYEAMPTSWPLTPETGFHGDWIIRKRAYWSLFSGSFGHTYGHCSVWCSISEKEKSEISRYTWCEALDSAGSWQIKILRDFMEAIPLSQCEPAKDLVVGNTQDLEGHIEATLHKKKEFLCAYLPQGGGCTLKLAALKSGASYTGKLYGWWFNPKDGKCYDAEHKPTEQGFICENPGDEQEFLAPLQGEEQDWILLLFAKETAMPVPAKEYGRTESRNIDKKVF